MLLLTCCKLPWPLRLNVLPHPPNSPDLAPTDSCLFQKLKINLSGRNFGSNEGVIDAVNEYLGTRMKTFILKV